MHAIWKISFIVISGGFGVFVMFIFRSVYLYSLLHACSQSKLHNSLGNSTSLQQNQFLMGTQAFASPPDMASSGIWENIILTKTHTFEGVCRMLYFIILNFVKKIFFWLLFVDIW